MFEYRALSCTAYVQPFLNASHPVHQPNQRDKTKQRERDATIINKSRQIQRLASVLCSFGPEHLSDCTVMCFFFFSPRVLFSSLRFPYSVDRSSAPRRPYEILHPEGLSSSPRSCFLSPYLTHLLLQLVPLRLPLSTRSVHVASIFPGTSSY